APLESGNESPASPWRRLASEAGGGDPWWYWGLSRASLGAQTAVAYEVVSIEDFDDTAQAGREEKTGGVTPRGREPRSTGRNRPALAHVECRRVGPHRLRGAGVRTAADPGRRAAGRRLRRRGGPGPLPAAGGARSRLLGGGPDPGQGVIRVAAT